MAKDVRTNKLLNQLKRDGYNVKPVMSYNSRAKNGLIEEINTYLPEKYHHIVSTLYEFIFHLILAPRVSGNWVSISSDTLDSTYQKIYRKKFNTHDPSKTTLDMLEEDKIVLTDNGYQVGLRNNWYRLNPKILPLNLILKIKRLHSNVLVTAFEKGYVDTTNMDDRKSLSTLLDYNRDNPIQDTFVIKDEKHVKLTGISETILENGLIGPNYTARFLYVDVYKNYLKVLDYYLEDIEKHPNKYPDYISFEKDTKKRLENTAESFLQKLKDIKQGKIEKEIFPITESKEIIRSDEFLDDSFLNLPQKATTKRDIKNLKIFINQFNKLIAIFTNTQSTTNEFNILFHRSPQSVSYGGRLFETGNLGTTGMTKELKSKNYDYLTKLTGIQVHNYDLVASQLSAILQYGDKHGVEFPTLEKYVNQLTNRERRAKRLGVTPSVFKKLILIKVFGGKDTFNAYYPGSVQEVMAEEGIVETELKDYLKKFTRQNEDLLSDIKEWEDLVPKIMSSYYEEGTENKKRPSDRWYSNKVTVVRESFLNTVKKQSSFLLQGMEARFIYNLIQYSRFKESQYYFLSYEFDGLMTLGELPPRLIEEAKKASGFHRANLVLKKIA